MDQVYEAGLSFLAVVLTALIGHASRKIAAYFEGERAKAIVERATEAVRVAVESTEQLYAAELRKQGKIENPSALHAVALRTTCQILGDAAMAELDRAIGDADVADWLSKQIEASVHRLKKRQIGVVF